MKIVKVGSLPKCCYGCNHLVDLENQWEDTVGYICNTNRFIPTVKKECDKSPINKSVKQQTELK